MAYLFALLKYIIYGLSVFFTRELTEHVDVLDILALRFLMSASVMWILKNLKIIKIDIGVKDFIYQNDRSSHLKVLLMTALFEPVLYMVFETVGISMTTGITAGVILAFSPIAFCVAEEVILKEKSTLMQKLFLGIGMIGVLYMAVNTASKEGTDTILGMLLIALAVCSGALYATFSRKSSKAFSAMEITYISCCLGMIAFNLANIIRHIWAGTIVNYFAPYFSVSNMIGFVFLGVISTIVATGMNNFALARIQASTMSAFGGVSTMVTIFVSAVFLKEKIYGFHVLGITLIIIRMIGVSYISIMRDKKQKAADKG